MFSLHRSPSPYTDDHTEQTAAFHWDTSLVVSASVYLQHVDEKQATAKITNCACLITLQNKQQQLTKAYSITRVVNTAILYCYWQHCQYCFEYCQSK